MDICEYLLTYGLRGDFGRFRPAAPLALRRGDRAVVRSRRGLELAEVLREAAPGHAVFLPNTTVGTLLRAANADDEAAADHQRRRALALADRAAARGRELDLPLEVLDAEILLDGSRGVLHLVRWDDADVRPLVSTLSREFELEVELADLSGAGAAPGGHGCGSCGSGGGCGSCGSANPAELHAYFAGLREQIDRRHALL